eukprot:14148783-Alexandrium_andersonii.AAC.1
MPATTRSGDDQRRARRGIAGLGLPKGMAAMADNFEAAAGEIIRSALAVFVDSRRVGQVAQDTRSASILSASHSAAVRLHVSFQRRRRADPCNEPSGSSHGVVQFSS